MDYEVHEWLGVVHGANYFPYGHYGPKIQAGECSTLDMTLCTYATDKSYGTHVMYFLPEISIAHGNYTYRLQGQIGNSIKFGYFGVNVQAFTVPNTSDFNIKVTTERISVNNTYAYTFHTQKEKLIATINDSYHSMMEARFRDVVIDGINYYPVRLLHSIPADSDYNGIARNAGDCGLINTKTGKFYGSTSLSTYGYFTVENEFIKSKLQALVPKASATSVIFDYTANQDTTNYELIGYVDKYNYIACYQKGTEYLILSSDVIYAPEDCSNLFVWYSKLAVLQFNNFNTRAVRNMSQMIAATAITNIDVSMFSTTMVTNMYSMFSNNQKLKSINIDNFNTSKVPNFEGMFYQNLALTTAHVNINTANATNSKGFFYYCYHLKTIYSNDWNTDKVTQDTDMFAYCGSLVGGNGTTYNARKKGKEMAVVDEVIETTVDEETVETIKEGYFTKPE